MAWIERLLGTCTDWQVFCLIEAHPGLASYLQAVLSFIAILAAWWLSRRQSKADQHRDADLLKMEARGLALLIKVDLWRVRDDANQGAIATAPNTAEVALPDSIEKSLSRLWVMGSSGEHVLKVVAFVIRHAEMRDRILRQSYVVQPPMILKARQVLTTLAAECDLAVADLDKMSKETPKKSIWQWLREKCCRKLA